MARNTLLDRIDIYIMNADDKELQSLEDLIKTEKLVRDARRPRPRGKILHLKYASPNKSK